MPTLFPFGAWSLTVLSVWRVLSDSVEKTEAVGWEWAQEVGPGWVITLHGEVGSGKTTLVRGLARGLASPARVHSPSFSLLHVYRGGRLPLYHLDLYRLEGPESILATGLDQYFVTEGVTIIEWPERLGAGEHWPDWAARPVRLRRVKLEMTGSRTRWITYEDVGG
ncbi:MAG: tRNA (adenosine(37)-N6)-threonylcarbamoyltransferase complex ATPase subunit type 1 TsaE [Verrucomicrobiota bacterium]|nr:tRNA (adenosine(37)-N6)-threonylcarbamoyltransferase complex ATPase subunit type 1 TsaE [Limisphaera sp.]MDW8381805.1 tRNA (adenosine(37)-N6)-threonylcarbamoyltransferase complex ATPase subunit type 1 TsaE [Verrucomicrobiota bacterium]